MEGFVWILRLVLLLLAPLCADTLAIAMDDRTDTMGQYALDNRVQCQRLCWYRRLCTAFSFNDRLSAGAANCVLHADPLQGQRVVFQHLRFSAR